MVSAWQEPPDAKPAEKPAGTFGSAEYSAGTFGSAEQRRRLSSRPTTEVDIEEESRRPC